METIFIPHSDYLAHHGIKGQKWGIRRYQNEDGSLTQLGRQRRGIPDKSVREKIKDKVSKRKEEKAAKAKESEAEKHEALKEHVRKHPSKLYKYRTEFSDEEIRDLTNKIRTDTALKDIRDAEIQRGWDKVQQFRNNMEKVKNLADTGKNLYNLAAEVNNFLVDSGKVNGKRMLKIGEKPEEKKVDRAAILRNMSVDDIVKNQKAFTANELGEYVKWANSVDILNKRAAELAPKEKTTEEVVQDIMDNLPKQVNWYGGPGWYASHSALMTNVEDILESDDYLAHFGILGMKWGVRRYQNADGTLTAEGKARYARTAQDIIGNAKYNEDVSGRVFAALGADKKYLDQANDILAKNYEYGQEVTKETNKMFKDLRSEDKIHFYEAASELAEHADYYGANGDVDEMSLGDMGSVGFHGVLDDGQQGMINAYSMYASEHNLADKIERLGKEEAERSANAVKEAKECLKKAFSDVGMDDLPAYSGSSASAAGILISHLRNARYDDWDKSNGSYYLDQARYAINMKEKDKQNISKASKYVSKINKNHDTNTWWYVSEAAENLGMDSIKLKNMTQSDWDKLNAEIADLRARNGR